MIQQTHMPSSDAEIKQNARRRRPVGGHRRMETVEVELDQRGADPEVAEEAHRSDAEDRPSDRRPLHRRCQHARYAAICRAAGLDDPRLAGQGDAPPEREGTARPAPLGGEIRRDGESARGLEVRCGRGAHTPRGRPRPSPAWPWPPGPRVKGWNSRSRVPGGIGGPSFTTATTSSPSSIAARTATVPSAAPCVRALARRLDKSWPRRRGSQPTGAGRSISATIRRPGQATRSSAST